MFVVVETVFVNQNLMSNIHLVSTMITGMNFPLQRHLDPFV